MDSKGIFEVVLCFIILISQNLNVSGNVDFDTLFNNILTNADPSQEPLPKYNQPLEFPKNERNIEEVMKMGWDMLKAHRKMTEQVAQQESNGDTQLVKPDNVFLMFCQRPFADLIPYFALLSNVYTQLSKDNPIAHQQNESTYNRLVGEILSAAKPHLSYDKLGLDSYEVKVPQNEADFVRMARLIQDFLSNAFTILKSDKITIESYYNRYLTGRIYAQFKFVEFLVHTMIVSPVQILYKDLLIKILNLTRPLLLENGKSKMDVWSQDCGELIRPEYIGYFMNGLDVAISYLAYEHAQPTYFCDIANFVSVTPTYGNYVLRWKDLIPPEEPYQHIQEKLHLLSLDLAKMIRSQIPNESKILAKLNTTLGEIKKSMKDVCDIIERHGAAILESKKQSCSSANQTTCQEYIIIKYGLLRNVGEQILIGHYVLLMSPLLASGGRSKLSEEIWDNYRHLLFFCGEFDNILEMYKADLVVVETNGINIPIELLQDKSSIKNKLLGFTDPSAINLHHNLDNILNRQNDNETPLFDISAFFHKIRTKFEWFTVTNRDKFHGAAAGVRNARQALELKPTCPYYDIIGDHFSDYKYFDSMYIENPHHTSYLMITSRPREMEAIRQIVERVEPLKHISGLEYELPLNFNDFIIDMDNIYKFLKELDDRLMRYPANKDTVAITGIDIENLYTLRDVLIQYSLTEYYNYEILLYMRVQLGRLQKRVEKYLNAFAAAFKIAHLDESHKKLKAQVSPQRMGTYSLYAAYLYTTYRRDVCYNIHNSLPSASTALLQSIKTGIKSITLKPLQEKAFKYIERVIENLMSRIQGVAVPYVLSLTGKNRPSSDELEFEATSELVLAYSLKAQFLNIAFRSELNIEKEPITKVPTYRTAYSYFKKDAKKAVKIREQCEYRDGIKLMAYLQDYLKNEFEIDTGLKLEDPSTRKLVNYYNTQIRAFIDDVKNEIRIHPPNNSANECNPRHYLTTASRLTNENLKIFYYLANWIDIKTPWFEDLIQIERNDDKKIELRERMDIFISLGSAFKAVEIEVKEYLQKLGHHVNMHCLKSSIAGNTIPMKLIPLYLTYFQARVHTFICTAVQSPDEFKELWDIYLKLQVLAAPTRFVAHRRLIEWLGHQVFLKFMAHFVPITYDPQLMQPYSELLKNKQYRRLLINALDQKSFLIRVLESLPCKTSAQSAPQIGAQKEKLIKQEDYKDVKDDIKTILNILEVFITHPNLIDWSDIPQKDHDTLAKRNLEHKGKVDACTLP